MFRKTSAVVLLLALTSFCLEVESSEIQKESKFFWRPGTWIPLNIPIPQPAGGSTPTTCGKKTECIDAAADKCGNDNKCGTDTAQPGTVAPTDCYVQQGTCTAPSGVTKACGATTCPA